MHATRDEPPVPSGSRRSRYHSGDLHRLTHLSGDTADCEDSRSNACESRPGSRLSSPLEPHTFWYSLRCTGIRGILGRRGGSVTPPRPCIHSAGLERIRRIEVYQENNMPERRGTLFVHVGMPRTGSTTIRHALKKLDPELRKRGIQVPATGRLPDFSHSNLVTLLSGEWYLEHVDADAWQALEREIAVAGACTVVMSGSMFTAHGLFTKTPGQLAAQHVENLANACGLEVCILGYVRPQAELLESVYVRLPLRTFSAEPFSEYARITGSRPVTVAIRLRRARAGHRRTHSRARTPGSLRRGAPTGTVRASAAPAGRRSGARRPGR